MQLRLILTLASVSLFAIPASAAGLSAIDRAQATKDKLVAPMLTRAYAYETRYVTPTEMRERLNGALAEELGQLLRGRRPQSLVTPLGHFEKIYGTRRHAAISVMPNGHVLARLGDGEAPDKATGSDLEALIRRAVALAGSLGVVPNIDVCLAGAPSTSEGILTCPFADLKHSEQGTGDSRRVVVMVDPRLVIGVDAGGREVWGGLRGAGLRAEFDARGFLVSLEARPLEIVGPGLPVMVVKTPKQSLNSVAPLLRSTGFDPLGMLGTDPVLGYAVGDLPSDVSKIPSLPELEHRRTLRADELERRDPALPPPLLRPSYLFGMSLAPVPVEPRAVPLDEERPTLAEIMPVYEKGKISAYEARVGFAGPVRFTVEWHGIGTDGRIVSLGEGLRLENIAKLGSGRAVLVTVKDHRISRTLPVHSAMIWTPPAPTPADVAMIPTQVGEQAKQCGRPSPFGFPPIRSVARTASTDLRALPFGEDLAATAKLDHLDIRDRIEIANRFNGSEAVFDDNYLATTNVGNLYEVKVDKVKPLGNARLGSIMTRQAPTHFAFSFKYKVAGSAAGQMEGLFQSDLCHANPRNGVNVCHGGFGKALKPGHEEMSYSVFYFVDQRYDLTIDEYTLGFMDARYVQDLHSRADGGPGFSDGFLFKVNDWDEFLKAFLGVSLPDAVWNELLNQLRGFDIGNHLTSIYERHWLLGRSRPSVTSKASYSFRPDPCLTLGDVQKFCAALGSTRKPIVSNSETPTYCTGPAASATLSEVEKTLPVVVSDVLYYAMMEVLPAFPTGNLFVEEGWLNVPVAGQRPVPVVERASGRFMTNLSRLMEIDGLTNIFPPDTDPTDVVLNFTGTMTTVTPNEFTGNAAVSVLGATGMNLWDNVHMKDLNPSAGGGRGASSIPGNIVIPGCSPLLPYWYAGVRVQRPELAAFATDPRTLTIFVSQLMTWKYAWDPVPDCIHRHSKWHLSSNWTQQFYLDTAIYQSLHWSIVKAGYNAGLPDYRPIAEAEKHTRICSPAGNKIPFSAPYDSPKEQPYSCVATKLVEVGVSKGGGFHGAPTFFTE